MTKKIEHTIISSEVDAPGVFLLRHEPAVAIKVEDISDLSDQQVHELKQELISTAGGYSTTEVGDRYYILTIVEIHLPDEIVDSLVNNDDELKKFSLKMLHDAGEYWHDHCLQLSQ